MMRETSFTTPLPPHTASGKVLKPRACLSLSGSASERVRTRHERAEGGDDPVRPWRWRLARGAHGPWGHGRVCLDRVVPAQQLYT